MHVQAAQHQPHRLDEGGEPGYESDAVPAFDCKVEDGHLLVDLASKTKRSRSAHPPHPPFPERHSGNQGTCGSSQSPRRP